MSEFVQAAKNILTKGSEGGKKERRSVDERLWSKRRDENVENFCGEKEKKMKEGITRLGF